MISASGIPLNGAERFTGNFFTFLNPYALLGGVTTLADPGRRARRPPVRRPAPAPGPRPRLACGFPVVILDEPAEHLDEATADELTRDLLSAVEGRTVLLITHRPVTPGAVDQILRLDATRLIPAE